MLGAVPQRGPAADTTRRATCSWRRTRAVRASASCCVEAMAAGLPGRGDATSRATGRWSRDGIDGLLVPPRDPAALAAAVRRLLDEPESWPRALARPAGSARGALRAGRPSRARWRPPTGTPSRSAPRRYDRSVLAVLDRPRDRRRSCSCTAVSRLQPARAPARPRRQRLVADRRAAQPPLRPDPEPGRDREGLRRARARGVRGRSRRPARRRHGRDRACRTGAGREPAHAGARASCSPWPRTTRT